MKTEKPNTFVLSFCLLVISIGFKRHRPPCYNLLRRTGLAYQSDALKTKKASMKIEAFVISIGLPSVIQSRPEFRNKS